MKDLVEDDDALREAVRELNGVVFVGDQPGTIDVDKLARARRKFEDTVRDLLGIMTQEAPFPSELKELVSNTRYKPNWRFFLAHGERDNPAVGELAREVGLTLTIQIYEPDTYRPDKMICVNHIFPVPPATYDRRSWQMWLFEQIAKVEKHEAMEFFRQCTPMAFGARQMWLFEQIAKVEKHETTTRPYAPNHGPGNDPYLIMEVGTLQEKRTSYLGEQRDTDAPAE